MSSNEVSWCSSLIGVDDFLGLDGSILVISDSLRVWYWLVRDVESTADCVTIAIHVSDFDLLLVDVVWNAQIKNQSLGILFWAIGGSAECLWKVDFSWNTSFSFGWTNFEFNICFNWLHGWVIHWLYVRWTHEIFGFFLLSSTATTESSEQIYIVVADFSNLEFINMVLCK